MPAKVLSILLPLLARFAVAVASASVAEAAAPCNTTVVAAAAAAALVDELSNASWQSAAVVPTATEMLQRILALARVDSFAAADLFKQEVLSSQCSDGRFAHMNYAWNGTLAQGFPSASSWGPAVDGSCANSSALLIASPIHATVALDIFYRLFNSSSSSSSGGSSSGGGSSPSSGGGSAGGGGGASSFQVAALQFLETAWLPLYRWHSYLMAERTLQVAGGTGSSSSSSSSSTSAINTGLLITLSPFEGCDSSAAVFTMTAPAAAAELTGSPPSSSCVPGGAAAIPSSVTSSAMFPGYEAYYASWCITQCLLGTSPQPCSSDSSSGTAWISLQDNLLLARSSSDLFTIAQWLQQEQQSGGLQPPPGGSGGGGAEGVFWPSNDQLQAVKQWSTLTLQSLLQYAYMQPASVRGKQVPLSAGRGLRSHVPASHPSLWTGAAASAGWLYDLVLSNATQVMGRAGANAGALPSSSSLTITPTVFPAESSAALLALWQAASPPSAMASLSPLHPDWQQQLLNSLVQDFFPQPLLTTLARGSSFYSSSNSSLGPVSALQYHWIRDALVSTSSAASQDAGLTALLTSYMDGMTSLLCTAAAAATDAGSGTLQPQQMAVLFDGNSGAPLPSSSSAFIPGAVAGILLSFTDPGLPIPLPPFFLGTTGLFTVMAVELLVLLAGGVGCVLLGVRSVRKLQQERSRSASAVAMSLERLWPVLGVGADEGGEQELQQQHFYQLERGQAAASRDALLAAEAAGLLAPSSSGAAAAVALSLPRISLGQLSLNGGGGGGGGDAANSARVSQRMQGGGQDVDRRVSFSAAVGSSSSPSHPSSGYLSPLATDDSRMRTARSEGFEPGRAAAFPTSAAAAGGSSSMSGREALLAQGQSQQQLLQQQYQGQGEPGAASGMLGSAASSLIAIPGSLWRWATGSSADEGAGGGGDGRSESSGRGKAFRDLM